MASPQELNSLGLKRKLIDDCLSKDCKSRRVKAENGPSSDSSAKPCSCHCTRPNLANDCVNYLRSGVPTCIMYYKHGSWNNFPEQIMRSLIEEFRGNKSSVVTVMDDEPVLVDFLSMTLVNLKTRKQRSVAWFDDTGKCYLPSLFFDEESDGMAKNDPGNVEGIVPAVILDNKVASAPPEEVKQVVLECSPPVHQKPSAAVLRKKITSVERGSKDFLFVQDLFLSAMGPFATSNRILHVHRYSPNDITAQCRFEAFERQMRSTKEARGDANVRYGWLGSRKNDIIRILINGLDGTAKPVEKAGLNAGVYLSPENRAFTSVGLCDVDEKGVQYMLLCQVILGNMEAIEHGSQKSFPSSEIYDSGVDDCSNPKCYVMWPSHLSTHIRLEYLISFKLAAKVRNYLCGLKGLWFHPSLKDAAADISTLQPIPCEIGQGPASPWISFRVLFGVIQDNLSPIARELLFHHHEELMKSIITREEMVKKMMIIVGEKVLLEALKKIHYCPSLWGKSSVGAVSSDPARAAVQQLSLDKTGGNCSSALTGNRGDSHAPDAVAEHRHPAAPRAKASGSLETDVVCKAHDCLAPTGVPETCNPPDVKPDGRDFPIQSMSPGNYATLCSKNHDSSVTRMPPIVRDGLLRTTSGRSASPGFTSKVCETAVPSLALGNSKITSPKLLKSAPRTTPEGKEFLSLGVASQGPVHSAGSREGSSSVATPQFLVPGQGNLPPVSTEGCDPKPKLHDHPASSKQPKHHKFSTADKLLESHHREAQDAATKVYNVPAPKTKPELKDEAAPSGPAGVDPSSSRVVARAAVALVCLSMPREMGGR